MVDFGQHLHVVVITPVGNVDWGQLYVYDMRLGQPENDEVSVPENRTGLFDTNILASTVTSAQNLILSDANEVGVSMAALGSPSFAALPPNTNQLRLSDASCRKPHTWVSSYFPATTFARRSRI